MTEASQKIYTDMLDGTKHINDLNPEKAVHRLAVLEYLKAKPSRIKALETDTELAFLEYCIKTDYTLFVSLNPEQITDKLAKIYIEKKLSADDNAPKGFLTKDFNENFVFNVKYETCDGEQIFYYDDELKLSTFLVAKLAVAFKVDDILSFLKKLDVSVSMIGYNSISCELTSWIKNTYRKVINKYIDSKKISVYKINSITEDIEKDIFNAFDVELEDSGISVHKVSVGKISVTDNMQRLLEKQSLEFMQSQKEKDAEIEYEKKSLVNYAQKAEIHTKNPTFAVTLTEAEKDFALNRYITKHDVDAMTYKKNDPAHDSLSERNAQNADNVIGKGIDKPYMKKKLPIILLLFIPALILLILAFAQLGSSVALFFAFLGLSIIPAGVATAFLIQAYANNEKTMNATDKAEYEAQVAEYNSLKKGAGARDE